MTRAIRSSSWAHVAVSLSVITALGTPGSAVSAPFSLAGQFTGLVNGVAVNASITGQLDTSGTALNQISYTFQSIPADFHPSAVFLSPFASYLAVEPSGGALNLFGLTGGAYAGTRATSWPALPGEQITRNLAASIATGSVTATGEINGTYSGPTDFVGVSGYTMLWTQLDPTSIQVVSSYTLARPDGSSFGVEMTTVYSGLSAEMPFPQQGSITFTNVSLSNGVFAYEWRGTIAPVPEPTSGTLLGFGLLGALWSRRLRPRYREARGR